jgi:hypothetical protein
MRMPRTLRAFACAVGWLLAAGLAAAQSACPPPPPRTDSLRAEVARADGRDRGFLWRVVRHGRTSWLYGTVHVGRPDWGLPGRRIQAALAGADVLALELDPSDPELARVFTAPPDPDRMARVTAGLEPRLAEAAARECLPVGALSVLRPVLQVTTVGLWQGRRDGFHPELAADTLLWGLARQAGKPVIALETAASQLAVFTPETEDDERELLVQGLDDIASGKSRTMIKRLLRVWADSDAAALASYPKWCRCMDSPQERRFMQRLNDERNGPMADKLAGLDASGRSFFAAVGAMHMTGPQALTDLLRARGFQVEPVPLSSRRTAP